MQTVKINRGITSALVSPTHDPIAEYIREFRARSKSCLNQLYHSAVTSICQFIDDSIAVASAPAHVLYQGIPAAVVQGSLDVDSLKIANLAAKNLFKSVALSSSECLSVEAFLIALNTHVIYKQEERKCVDDDVDIERGNFWKVPRSTSKSASITSVCNWLKKSGQAVLLCIDCFEKISTHVLSDIVSILWTARFDLPVVMLLMSQCDSETVRQALSFSKSRFLRINNIFRLPSPSEQLEFFFSSVLAADNLLPLLLDPQSVVILRNRFHQTERVVDSFVDGIALVILLHSYHNPHASAFFEFHAVKSAFSQNDVSSHEVTRIGMQQLHSRIMHPDFIADINKLPSISSSSVEISAHNISHLFGVLCVRRTAYYAVPLLFRALLTSFSSRLTDMWGDTLVSLSDNPIWDGIQLGDGCESTAVEKISHVDRIRFIIWTCTPEVARKLLEDFGSAVSCALSAIQSEYKFITKFIRNLSSAESDEKKHTADSFLADIPVLVQALQLSQSSISSLATFGEDCHWEAPFVSKSKDDCVPMTSVQFHKRRKVLGTAAVKAACGSNRVKFRFNNASGFFSMCYVISFIDAQSGKQ